MTKSVWCMRWVWVACAWGLLLASLGCGRKPGKKSAGRSTTGVKLPRVRVKKHCKKCHAKILARQSQSAHAIVDCGACHTTRSDHWKDPKKNKPSRDGSQTACVRCHKKQPSRPAKSPHFAVAKHYRLVGVKDLALACTKCHDPHDPVPVNGDRRSVRVHPKMRVCRDCHGVLDGMRGKPPKGHPKAFECRSCHQKRQAEFAKAKHAKLRCATCHFFAPAPASVRRTVRGTNHRLCLMCHRKAAYRSQKSAPAIAWRQHMREVEGKPLPGKVCVQCHMESIHGTKPAKK